ncbi:uncharacterized protein LOC122377782 isoform X2 [Amphibalanus amphitrite]|uniref:uncharacterized protein LOC122377782 isoform X2 n=1 Tax=Amphibalanus amphitrite TaxID=1232801 RepID=UPI001C916865|nr:uncharacterized protein LOC122377782 isoform X2 [Amphibalanus amphitrite]
MHQYLKNKECPLLSEDVLAELKNNGIKTVLAFLSRDSEALIHACSLTYQEVVSVKKVLFAKYSALPCSATDLLDQPSVAPLASGCDRVDGLLGGGLPAGDLVELCGPSAVGKTQLCLAWAAAALLAGARVLVADAKCEFSVARCRRLLRRRGRSAQVTRSPEVCSGRSATGCWRDCSTRRCSPCRSCWLCSRRCAVGAGCTPGCGCSWSTLWPPWRHLCWPRRASLVSACSPMWAQRSSPWRPSVGSQRSSPTTWCSRSRAAASGRRWDSPGCTCRTTGCCSVERRAPRPARWRSRRAPGRAAPPHSRRASARRAARQPTSW